MGKTTGALVIFSHLEKLDVSIVEYCFLQIVYNLQNNPRSKFPGWCYASKPYIAKHMRVTDRSVFNAIKKMKEKKLLIVNSKGHLATTEEFYNKVIMEEDTHEKISGLPMKNFHGPHEKISSNISTDISNDISSSFKEDSPHKEVKDFQDIQQTEEEQKSRDIVNESSVSDSDSNNDIARPPSVVLLTPQGASPFVDKEREKRILTAETKLCIKFFMERYKVKEKNAYIVNWGEDTKSMMKVVKAHGKDKTEKFIISFFALRGELKKKFGARTIRNFVSRLNEMVSSNFGSNMQH